MFQVIIDPAVAADINRERHLHWVWQSLCRMPGCTAREFHKSHKSRYGNADDAAGDLDSLVKREAARAEQISNPKGGRSAKWYTALEMEM